MQRIPAWLHFVLYIQKKACEDRWVCGKKLMTDPLCLFIFFLSQSSRCMAYHLPLAPSQTFPPLKKLLCDKQKCSVICSWRRRERWTGRGGAMLIKAGHSGHPWCLCSAWKRTAPTVFLVLFWSLGTLALSGETVCVHMTLSGSKVVTPQYSGTDSASFCYIRYLFLSNNSACIICRWWENDNVKGEMVWKNYIFYICIYWSIVRLNGSTD